MADRSEQMALFDLPYEVQRDCAAQIARLSRQCRRILDRLLRGEASNSDLARFSLKYTGRISDLRKMLRPKGFDIECYERDYASGVSWYRLTRFPEAPVNVRDLGQKSQTTRRRA